MKIAVCVKAVPGQVTKVKVADSGDKLKYESSSFMLNEADEYALEEALLLRTQSGGEVIVMTAGLLRSQQVLYLGLAKGGDRAVRVDVDLMDGQAVSLVLAEAIRKVGADLVLTGVESSDNMGAQVGVSIAERLGIPFAYAVTLVELASDLRTVRVTKELGGGLKQVVEMFLPAILCIQVGTQPVSYTPTRKLLQARGKPIQCLSLADLGISDDYIKATQHLKIVDVFPASKTRRAEIIEGEPMEIARIMLNKIKEVL